ncbi:MAG: response regulator [Thermodesulfobacteriota bacterium]|nr:response regulator [Thermodesulfobacteriota bacterium]
MSKLDILVVDDDRDSAESLSDVLHLDGHRVEIAFKGEDAIKILKDRDFDMTFMDVKLPGKNGVESFLEIRKIKPETRVIMMTGYSVEQLLTQAVKNGAWGVLHKPLEMNNVLKMLRKIKPDGILIADDDPDFVQAIRDVLENNGFKVLVAKNGREAVERVCSNEIDVLILDLRMPVLNGLDTYLELKKSGHGLPTIIVTAYAREEAEALKTLRSFSVTGILTKPFDPKDLLRSIENLSKQET